MQTLQEVSLQNTSKQAPKFAQNLKKDKVMPHKVLEQESQPHFLESHSLFLSPFYIAIT